MTDDSNPAQENGPTSGDPREPCTGGAIAEGVEARSYTTAQVLLGVLVVGQLLFLLAANTLNGLSSIRRITGYNEDVGATVDHLTGGITSSRGHWYDVYRLVNRWEELWNTLQNWRLFSPYVSDGSCLLSVELRWDDRAPGAAPPAGATPPVVLLSSNEPPNLQSYVRLGPWRFRRYESHLALDLRVGRNETEAAAATRWKAQIAAHVDGHWDALNAYLNWKWVTHQRRHPDCPRPEQLILVARCWVIQPPEEHFGRLIGPQAVPLARWRPARAEAGTRAAIEAYDPETRTFVTWGSKR